MSERAQIHAAALQIANSVQRKWGGGIRMLAPSARRDAIAAEVAYSVMGSGAPEVARAVVREIFTAAVEIVGEE